VNVGEAVVLDGAGSSDVDLGTILTYHWSSDDAEFPETEDPTLAVGTLAAGTHTFTLTVEDDSGDAATSFSASDTVTITVLENAPPTANAGEDQTIEDTDGAPGELVTLTGSGTDSDGTIASYEWFFNDEALGEGQTLEAELPDGVNQVALVVTDDDGETATDTVIITVVGPAAPTANAGVDQNLTDSDGEPGEDVTLDGSASGATGGIASYVWQNAQEEQIATGVAPTVRLPDGDNVITLIVANNEGVTASDTATISIAAPALTPVANAGPDQEVADTDGADGEEVTLNGSASTDPNGDTLTYEWTLDGATPQVLGTGATLNVRLPDGENTVTLRVEDPDGNFDVDTVVIEVVSFQSPVANAGIDQEVADSDREEGETVTLDGTASSDPNGDALSYQWSLVSDPVVVLGEGATLSVRLPDGESTVSLRVEDPQGNFAVDTVVITIGAPAARISLAELPNLTPNKQAVAQALDRICVQLEELSSGDAELTQDQQALQERCNGLYFDNTAENQSAALDALGADDFAAARIQTLLFSNTLYASVMDRLVALRGGARGLSLAGLNIMVDGQYVPLAQLQEMAKELLGGGASSDADEPGGLLSDKWGMWARGNFSFGEKDASPTSPSFEADQWALMGGIDYRVTDGSVIGGSLAYGQSGIDFNPAGEGALDTTSWAVSLYGSTYAAKNFYLDALVNIANSDYDAERNITYVDGTGLISADARGTTDGLTVSGGLSAGYDFLLGGLTISPNLGAFYIDASIDGFTESGAAGLNLIYDEQNFSSLTGNLGLRFTYAWNTSWGVLLPHLRVDYVREFEDDVDVFGVRFAADPNATSTPPILVETDNPDRSYWRMATGFSAQFTHGFSGYIEYQRLESFEFISFEDLSVGLRMQKSF
jgi:uncharacterized protein YhjY with autotransporter beta-barrel domain